MTLNEITVLIHLSVRSDLALAESWERNAIQTLLQRDMIALTTDTIHYEITEKGQCFIEHLKELPMPTHAWKMP